MSKIIQKLTAFFMALIISAGIITAVMPGHDALASSTGTVVNVSSSVNVRSEPSNHSDVITRLNLGVSVMVLATVDAAPSDTSGYASWYKIQFHLNGTVTTGYVATYFINKAPEATTPTTNTDFESSIASFPESYKPYLRALHQEHPNWTYTPVNTGIEWSEALDKESRLGVSLVEGSVDRSWKSLAAGAYDPATGNFVVVDSPSWVNASRAIIAYYMDPRNNLNSEGIFQFMDLRYTTDDLITPEYIEGVIGETFMGANTATATYLDENPMTYANIFSIAGNESNVNPIFLAARVVQECGRNGSTSSDGATGFYNFYNIGAYSDVYSASMLGLRFAELGNGNAEFNATYLIPWNTQGRSIVGGAKWIADHYTEAGQNTIYFMRFNFSPNSTRSPGTHQYMTATQSATAESSRIYSAFVKSRTSENAINFQIPVYNNMPEEACPIPTPENAATDFLKASYRVLFNRTPVDSEISMWSNQLRQNTEAVDVLIGLVLSPEFTNRNLNDDDYISTIYKLLTGQTITPELATEYKGLITNGYSRKYVYSVIANSEATTEYINLFGLIPGTYFSDDPNDITRTKDEFVTLLYTKFLGRNPDRGGLDYWSGRVGVDLSGPQLAAQFFNSGEYLSRSTTNEEFITTLYETCLGRTPDAAGFNSWVEKLESGYSRDYTLAGFVNSAEFKNICQTYGINTDNYVPSGAEYCLTPNPEKIGQFVTFLYTSTLEREPDAQGHDYWVNRIINDGLPGDEVAYGFIFSDEMINKNLSNEEYVTVLYNAFLGRSPDQAGFNDWVGRLESGASRYDVFNGFVYSTEFGNMCIAAGFKPYASFHL